MSVALVGIWVFFGASHPAFLSSRNLSLLLIELAATATLALGMLLVLLPGQIDLSAGSGVGLAGGVAAVLVYWHEWPAPLALACAFLLAVAVWSGMGALIVKQRIPAFIITLGGLLVFKGLHWLVIDNRTVPVAPGGEQNPYALLTTYYLPAWAGWATVGIAAATLVALAVRDRRRRMAHDAPVEDLELAILKPLVAIQLLVLLTLVAQQYRGVPLAALVLAAVALSVHVLTAHAPFGRYLYAIGGNEEAAHLSGVPVTTVVIGAFAMMGAIVALTGFLQTAYSGASTTTIGNLMELDAIAACVIGGTSLRGGRGNVVGVLFGALVMASLLNGMTLMAVSPEAKLIARGAILAVAVWVDVRLTGTR
jgi:D-xylose transport system permease protein